MYKERQKDGLTFPKEDVRPIIKKTVMQKDCSFSETIGVGDRFSVSGKIES